MSSLTVDGRVPAGSRLSRAADDRRDARLKDACRQLEAVFWQQLLRAMRRTIPTGGLLGRSYAKDVYTDLLDEQYALILAGQERAGLGRLLYEQLRAKQPLASPGLVDDGCEE